MQRFYQNLLGSRAGLAKLADPLIVEASPWHHWRASQLVA